MRSREDHRLPSLPWESKRQSSKGKPFAYRELWKGFLRGEYPKLAAYPRRDSNLWHTSYIQTYLERVVRTLRQVGDLSLFQNFIRILSARSAQLLNLTDVAMRYERSRGWTPTDVSSDGEHYDIRSEGPNGEKRFIEVKGRSRTGAIILTGPEVDKLQQLGSRAWLYIVTHCRGEEPRLRIIQDPISNLNPKMLFRQVQFVVEEADWTTKGAEAL